MDIESFNPHTHAGCDLVEADILASNREVSIHTPTQGVTNLPLSLLKVIDVSIHTPTQGVTKRLMLKDNLFQVSIHTPTQGVT